MRIEIWHHHANPSFQRNNERGERNGKTSQIISSAHRHIDTCTRCGVLRDSRTAYSRGQAPSAAAESGRKSSTSPERLSMGSWKMGVEHPAQQICLGARTLSTLPVIGRSLAINIDPKSRLYHLWPMGVAALYPLFGIPAVRGADERKELPERGNAYQRIGYPSKDGTGAS